MRLYTLSLFALCMHVASSASVKEAPSSGLCPVMHSQTSRVNYERITKSIANAVRQKHDNYYAVPSRKPSFQTLLGQKLQTHVLKNPNGFLSKPLFTFFSLHGAIKGGLPTLRESLGQNFCNSGTVVISEWDKVAEILTTKPQARTNRLGTGFLEPKKLPMKGGKTDRDLWLLGLSQKGAGGDGMHEAANGAVWQYWITPAMKRQKDPTAKALISQLVEDYKAMPHGTDGKFFSDKNRGLQPFLIKYLHYCLFGISPFDQEKMDVLYDYFYVHPIASNAAGYYLKPFGAILNLVSVFKFNRLQPKVAKIYEESPVIASLSDTITDKQISHSEFANMLIPIMSIAATVGPRHLLTFAMGCKKFNNWIPGVDTAETDVFKIWDGLNLDDTNEVERFLYEVGRLEPPVGHSHHVATEDITVKILGREHIFPAGTSIVIPLNLPMLDRNVWGETTYEFDHNRKNVAEKSMIFHSLGNKTYGRMCPGKFFALKMATEIIVECGKARRGMKMTK